MNLHCMPAQSCLEPITVSIEDADPRDARLRLMADPGVAGLDLMVDVVRCLPRHDALQHFPVQTGVLFVFGGAAQLEEPPALLTLQEGGYGPHAVRGHVPTLPAAGRAEETEEWGVLVGVVNPEIRGGVSL